jgi:DNA-directed RNA polymerase II subunit RPB1
MPGCSRTYGRWRKKEAIGRRTLQKYIKAFEDTLANNVNSEVIETVIENITILKSAAKADVLWDEIVDLIYHDDPKEYVYDFTVPGNDSFMVDNNILVHNTLNTFHQAGVASKSAVTRGVPRLRELLKVTQNPKATSLTIHLKPEYRNNKDKAREVVQDLELTVLRNITDKVAIYWDEKDDTTVIEEDRSLIKFYKLFEEGLMADEGIEEAWSKWVLRLELNREEMFNRNISIQEVVTVIKNTNDVNIVYSDYNSDKLVMRIRLPNNEMKGTDTASQLDDFTNLKKFQNKLLNSIVIRGLPGIKAVTFRKDKQHVEIIDGKYEQIEQYVLDTDGSNFINVMNHPAVDGTKLYSTNVWDVYEILGIEATRAILFNEINGLFESVGVNYRHLCLLCDVMTRFGKLMSIDRYGINKNDIGTLAKASFEETEKILLKAALFGEVDPVTGVSANIMMGQPIRGGTAFSQVLLDDQMLVKLLESVDVEKHKGVLEDEEEGDITGLAEAGLQLADPCSSAQFQMNMVLPGGNTTIEEPDIEIDIIES